MQLRRIVASPEGLGLRSHLGYLFLERSLFQIRRGDARCAREDFDLLKILAGEGTSLKKLEDYVVRLEEQANEDGVDPNRPFRLLPFPLP
jgi:hypothetical protein